MRRPLAALVPLLVLGFAAGCFVRSSEPPRFYRPESATLDASPTDVERGAAATTGAPVRVRSVEAAPFLRERIVWRTSALEYGQYEQRRWRELPATYVERALDAALLATPGVRLTDDVRAPALHVDVLSFDEVLAPAHVANVGVAVSLRDGPRRVLGGTFTAEVAIADDNPVSMARAMGRALDDVASQVARAVATSTAPAASAPVGTPRHRRHGGAVPSATRRTSPASTP